MTSNAATNLRPRTCLHICAGIGLALAHEFLRQDAHITLVARTASKLQLAVEELQQAAARPMSPAIPSRIIYQAADVTQPKQVCALQR